MAYTREALSSGLYGVIYIINVYNHKFAAILSKNSTATKKPVSDGDITLFGYLNGIATIVSIVAWILIISN